MSDVRINIRPYGTPRCRSSEGLKLRAEIKGRKRFTRTRAWKGQRINLIDVLLHVRGGGTFLFRERAVARKVVAVDTKPFGTG